MSHRKQQPTITKALIAQSQNVRVFVRFRPINKKEKAQQIKGLQDPGVAFNTKDTITVPAVTSNTGAFMKKNYTFDGVLSPTTTQREAFESIATHTCDDILDGYNGTIFVYGQTGSGKTHTMYGPEKKVTEAEMKEKELRSSSISSSASSRSSRSSRASKSSQLHAVRLQDDPEQMGIIPMSVAYIFESLNDKSNERFANIKGFEVKASFLEIYNDKLYDLINLSNAPVMQFDVKKQMKVVTGLEERTVENLGMMLNLIALATGNRTVSATEMNATSSRSHLILRLKVTIIKENGSQVTGVGNFADLAGSERQKKTKAKGDRFTEATNINKSLSVLQNVIEALSKRKVHVPYTECKLTHVLQESLGGNCKTTLLVAASPHIYNRSETISSLEFGKRCKMIKTKAVQNLAMTKKQLRERIDALTKENEMLRNSKIENANTVAKEDLKKQIEMNEELQTKLKQIETGLTSKDEELVTVHAEKAELETQLQTKEDEMAKMEVKTGELNSQIEILREEIATNGKQYELLQEEKNKYVTEIDKLTNDLSRVTQEKEQLKIQNNSYLREKDSNESKISSLEERIEQLKSMQREKMNEVIGQKENETKQNIINIETKYKEMVDSMGKELQDTCNKYDTLNKDYFDLETLKSKLETENNELKLKVSNLLNENNALKLEIERLKQRISELENENSVLNDKYNSLVDKYNNEREAWEEEKNNLEEKFEEMRHLLQLKTNQYDELNEKYMNELDKEKEKRILLEKQNIELKEESLQTEVNLSIAHQKELSQTKLHANKLEMQLNYLKDVYSHARQLQIESDHKLAIKLKKNMQIEAAVEELKRKHPNVPEDILRQSAIKTIENISINQFGQSLSSPRYTGNNSNNVTNNTGNNEEDSHISFIPGAPGADGGEVETEGYAVTKGAEMFVSQHIEEDRKQKEERDRLYAWQLQQQMSSDYKNDASMEKARKRAEKAERRKKKIEEKKRQRERRKRELEEREERLKRERFESQRRINEYERKQRELQNSVSLQQQQREQRAKRQKQRVLRANAAGVQVVGLSDDESSSDEQAGLHIG